MKRRVRARIVIGAIVAMRLASACAAQDAERPDYHVTDRWEFRMTQTPGSAMSTWAREIVGIDADALAVRFRSGALAPFDEAMNPIDAAGRGNSRILVRYPLRVGDAWTFVHRARDAGALEEHGEARVVGRETISVPAGTFDCFRVDARSRANGRLASEERLWNRWYCPAVKWIAKERFELRTFRPDGPPSDSVAVSELERFLPGR